MFPSVPWKRTSSSHRAQSADNQNKALLKLAEPQQNVKFQSHRVSAVKVMTFIGKEGDPETLGWGCVGGLLKLRTWDPQILKGFNLTQGRSTLGPTP